MPSDVTVSRDCDALQFVMRTTDDLQPQAGGVLDAFVRDTKAGRLKPHGTVRIQFGWTIFELVREGSRIVVREPDFDRDPAKVFRDAVRTSLVVTAQQVGVLRECGAQPAECRFDHTVHVLRDLRNVRKVYAHRIMAAIGTNSGWFFGDAEEEGRPAQDQIISVRSYELLGIQPGYTSILALPQEYLAQFDAGRLTEIVDPQNKKVFPKARA